MKKGGIILLDVQTNDILALVSTPGLNNDANSQGNHNQMIIPQTPGSVFKTVIAAAAIEEGIVLVVHIGIQQAVFSKRLIAADDINDQHQGRGNQECQSHIVPFDAVVFR